MSLIECTGIEKTYPDGTQALRGVSLSIKEGEFVSIIGPSGSGKSTLLHIFGLLDHATGGTYLLQGKRVSAYHKNELARIRNSVMGFVFQTFNLLPRTSALENVIIPLTYSDVPESKWLVRAKEALAQVGLAHREDHEPSELSGGERQRVAIARALIMHPEIIFADEPTGNLDSKAGEGIIDILDQLNKEGKTVILITHEESLARRARRMIVVKDGRIESDEILKT